MRRYLINLLIAIDQLGNVVLGGDNPDETISSAVGRRALAGRRWAVIAAAAIDALAFRLAGERNHCRNAALHGNK